MKKSIPLSYYYYNLLILFIHFLNLMCHSGQMETLFARYYESLELYF